MAARCVSCFTLLKGLMLSPLVLSGNHAFNVLLSVTLNALLCNLCISLRVFFALLICMLAAVNLTESQILG